MRVPGNFLRLECIFFYKTDEDDVHITRNQ